MIKNRGGGVTNTEQAVDHFVTRHEQAVEDAETFFEWGLTGEEIETASSEYGRRIHDKMHECWPFLDEEDELQVDRILRARQEKIEAGAEFTQSSIFKLGFAYGSFSGEMMDQGIHILLPVRDLEGNEENAEFKLLFRNYFNKIPAYKTLPKELQLKFGLMYMGAIAAFCREWNINIDHGHFITLFEEVVTR